MTRAQRPWILFIWVLNFCLMTLLLYGSTRFRAPVEPAIILFGSLALERIWAWRVREQALLRPEKSGGAGAWTG